MSAKSTIDIQAERDALQEQRLGVFRPTWSQLIQDTVLVTLDLGHWRATRKMSLTDLGLSEAPGEFVAFIKEYASVGSERLMPPAMLKSLASVETRTRQILEEVGFKSPWGGVLVPKRSYLAWRERTEGLKAQHRELADWIIEHYDEWIEETCDNYRKAHNALVAKYPELNETTDVEAYVEAIRGCIPPADEINEKFRFDWIPQVVTKPTVLISGIQLDDLEAQKLAVEAQIESLNERVRAGLAQTAVRDEQERLRIQREDLEARLHIERELESEIIAKAAEAKKREIEDVLSSVSAQIRTMLAGAAESVRDSIEKRGKIHDGTFQKLAGVVERVRSLNFAGDPEIDHLAGLLATMTATAVDDRDPEAIRRTLDDVATVVRADLAELGRSSRTGLDDDAPEITPLDLQRARRTVGLDVVEVEALPAPRRNRRRSEVTE